MSPRLFLALAAAALLGAVAAAAWSLTRPPEEQEVPPIRIESPAPLPHAERGEERERRGGGDADDLGATDGGGGDD